MLKVDAPDPVPGSPVSYGCGNSEMLYNALVIVGFLQ